jgi:hypothetical protein
MHHYDQKHGRVVWWKSWAMYGECLRRMGARGCEDWQSWCLPPPFWWWRWVREASRDALVRGMLRVVVDGLAFAMLKNTREALRLGVLGRVTAEQSSYAAAVAALGPLAELDLQRARDMTQGEAYTKARQGFAVVGAIAGAATAGVGSTLVGIVWGLAELGARLLPAAVMRVQDVWRRDQPVLERTTITPRRPSDDDPPSHDVPDPTGWVRPARASTGASLASPLHGTLFAPGAGSGTSVLGGSVLSAAQGHQEGALLLLAVPLAGLVPASPAGPPAPAPAAPPVAPPASGEGPRRWPWALGAGVVVLGAVALAKGAARRTDQ